jgi:hypothetical protein
VARGLVGGGCVALAANAALEPRLWPPQEQRWKRLVVPSGSATSIARAYLRDVPPVPINAAFGFAHGYLLRQS